MKAYLINLDRSPERLALFSAQAASAGLAFERVPAVDGRLDPGEAVSAAIGRNFEFQPVSPAEAALVLSHRVCWQRLIESGATWAAIFEDDAVLSADLCDALNAIEAVGPRADVIKLETTGRSVALAAEGTPLAGAVSLCRLLSWHGGTAAYVVSLEAARKLLAATLPVTDPVDQTMFHPLSRVSSRLAILQAVPAVAIQHDILHRGEDAAALVSTIGRRKQGLFRFRHGLLVDLRRAWLKHRERRLRHRMAKTPGNRLLAVPFAGTRNSGVT